jgi:hypothetical protein
MAAVTIATAEAHRDAFLAAELGLARNQSYSMPDGRGLTRADEKWVSGRIVYWQGVINSLTAEAAGVTNPGIKIAKWSTRR